MRITVAATPEIALPSLDWLARSSHQLISVLTQPDRPAGRGQQTQMSPVSIWANRNGVAVYKPDGVPQTLEAIVGADIVITIGYGILLPQEVLTVPEHGFLNVHFSLLPAWRGAAPVVRAIEQGDSVIGLTIFKLDAGMDTGPIYLRREIVIDESKNAGEILESLSLIAPSLIGEVLEQIGADIAPVAQSNEGVSYAKKIDKSQARINWQNNSLEIDRHIRAFTPTPGAWTTWRNEGLQIVRAARARAGSELSLGELVLLDGKVYVGCGAGQSLLVTEVKPAGKKAMSAAQWSNGARIVSGESFV